MDSRSCRGSDVNSEFEVSGEEGAAGLEEDGGRGGAGGDDWEGCLRFSDILDMLRSRCHELVISSNGFSIVYCVAAVSQLSAILRTTLDIVQISCSPVFDHSCIVT